jgi:predicted phosphodiesterase
VVLNGDILDLAACSLHQDSDAENRLASEIQAGNRFLDNLREHAGNGARIFYNEGNNEARLHRFIATKAPTLRNLTSLPEMLRLKQRKIEWMEYSGDNVLFVSPKLGVTHGFAHGVNYTRATLLKYNVSVIVGHAHRPEASKVPVIGQNGQHTRGCWGSGCLVPVTNVSYMKQPTGWTQGWTAVYVMKNGDFSVYPVDLHNGQVVWNGNVYGKLQRFRQK